MFFVLRNVVKAVDNTVTIAIKVAPIIINCKLLRYPKRSTLYTTFKTGTPIKVAPVKQIIPNNKIYTIIFFTDCLKSTILFSEYNRPNLLIYGCKR